MADKQPRRIRTISELHKFRKLPKPEDDLKILSPYLTSHIKRFGDYVVDLTEPPPQLNIEFTFSL